MSRQSSHPRRFLPLTHLAYHLLLSVAESPDHGYALAQRIRERTGGLVDPGTGSFYSIVKKLTDEGLLEESDEVDAEDTRRRRYEITALGRRVLAAEADRLTIQLAATRKLGLASNQTRGGR